MTGFRQRGVILSDMKGPTASAVLSGIHLLTGTDGGGKLLNGKFQILSNGITAVGINLEWSLISKIPYQKKNIESYSVFVLIKTYLSKIMLSQNFGI